MADKVLAGKAAIITGGAGGIGRGVARAFVKAGARVLIVDVKEEPGREAEAELRALGGDAHFLRFDLTEHERLGEIVDKAVASFGQLDTLVNVAQASRQALLTKMSLEDARIAFDTGFWPTFALMRAAYPHLAKNGGSIVNFASGAAFAAQPTQASYAAAKEAIRALSRVAAGEWGAKGIRINVVCPYALTPGVEQWKKDFPDAFAASLAQVPLKRIGDPEADIGAAVVFLASDAARYITGDTLMVDGGQARKY